MTGEEVLYRIATRASELEERDVEELPPLADRLDPDALVSLVDAGVRRIEFRYLDYVVVIVDGDVRLRETDECPVSARDRHARREGSVSRPGDDE